MMRIDLIIVTRKQNKNKMIYVSIELRIVCGVFVICFEYLFIILSYCDLNIVQKFFLIFTIRHKNNVKSLKMACRMSINSERKEHVNQHRTLIIHNNNV